MLETIDQEAILISKSGVDIPKKSPTKLYTATYRLKSSTTFTFPCNIFNITWWALITTSREFIFAIPDQIGLESTSTDVRSAPIPPSRIISFFKVNNKVGFLIDASRMVVSANQIEAERVSANKRAS